MILVDSEYRPFLLERSSPYLSKLYRTPQKDLVYYLDVCFSVDCFWTWKQSRNPLIWASSMTWTPFLVHHISSLVQSCIFIISIVSNNGSNIFLTLHKDLITNELTHKLNWHPWSLLIRTWILVGGLLVVSEDMMSLSSYHSLIGVISRPPVSSRCIMKSSTPPSPLVVALEYWHYCQKHRGRDVWGLANFPRFQVALLKLVKLFFLEIVAVISLS